MAKLTLSDISNLSGNPTSAQTTINANSALIEAALENTLSRDGTSPNTMEANLDMNSNRILNLPQAVNSSEPPTLAQLQAAAVATDIPDQASNKGKVLTTDGAAISWQSPDWVDFYTATYASATTFTVTGDQTADFHKGRPLKCTGGADVYTEVISSSYGAVTTVTTADTLNAGMDTVYLGVQSQNSTSSNRNYYRTLASETVGNIENYDYKWGNPLRYIPRTYHAGIRAKTNTTTLTTYLQNCLDDHGMLLFDPGQYKTAQLTLSTVNGVSIIGNGEVIIEEASATNGLWAFTSCDDLEIRNIQFLGAETIGAYQAGDAKSAISLTTCDRAKISQVYVTAKSEAIYFSNCTDSTIDDCHHVGLFTTEPTPSPVGTASYEIYDGDRITISRSSSKNTGEGVLIGNDAYEVHVIDNDIHNCYDDGIYISSGFNCTVSGNTVKTVTHSSNSPSAIKVRGTKHKVTENIIDSCKVGISVTGNGTTSDGYTDTAGNAYYNGHGTIVSNNSIKNCQLYGISTGAQDVDGSSNNLYPRHCIFENNVLSDCGQGNYYPVLIFGGIGMNFSNNTIVGSYKTIDSGVTEITYSLFFSSATTAPNTFNGLENQCNNNIIHSPATTGIVHLSSCDDGQCNGNIIKFSTAANGIRLTTADGNVITGNRIKGNGSETSINEQSGCTGNVFAANSGRVMGWQETASISLNNYMTGGTSVVTATGLAATPVEVGLIGVNAGVAYISTATSSSADWKALN